MVPGAAVHERLLIDTDGVHTPLRTGYYEAKVRRVGALGPSLREDPETGRTRHYAAPQRAWALRCECS
jgi:hypothetical protein